MPALDNQQKCALLLFNLLHSVCKENKVSICISRPKIVDAVIHYMRDIEKLDEHQGASISVNKRIAGLMFWVRRIKPISYASVNSGDEIQDINEQASVWLAHRLLLVYCTNPHAMNLMASCNVKSKFAEFEKYLRAHWSISEHFNYSSLVYSLRYRNFSPHHLAIILDTLTTGFVLKNTVLI